MASFEARLHIDGENEFYDLRSCTYSFSQQITSSGMPGSDVYGGTIHFEWENDHAQVDEALVKWMINPREKKSGSIKFMDSSEPEKTYKEIKFTDAFCVNFSESFTGSGQGLIANFTISAAKISIGEAEHVNKWDTKRGAA